MPSKVIDVSYANSNINWAKVKKAGIDGVIIRCGFRAYKSGRCTEDAMFSKHIAGAKEAGLKIGVYFFSQAIDEEEGREEAQYVLKVLKVYKLDPYYPIVIDSESISGVDARANNLSRTKRTAVVKAFCEEIRKVGYTPMIYANVSWLNNHLDMSKLPYKVWVAHYAPKCGYKGDYSLWQYSESGSVDGISGKVDMDYCYEEFKKEGPKMVIKWSGKLTDHFSLDEYYIGNSNTTLSITRRAYLFATMLEEFRIWLKRPMTVTSWKRSEALNKSVGGISTSNHLTGTACDWHTNISITKERFIKYAKRWKKICSKHGFVGEAGLYKWGIHFGIQSESQAKANGNKFFHWDSRTGTQKNNPFKELG